MKNLLLVIALFFPVLNADASERSECDGISTWKKIALNSPDVLMRTCDVFGMNYVEIKSQLNENRCIMVKNTNTGDQWKFFFLHKQSIKALGNPYFKPENLAVTSKDPKDNRCNS